MKRNSRFGWFEGDLLIQQNPVSKGDFVGHPFRGNQWGDASGAGSAYDPASDKRTRLTENDLHFNPFSHEAQNESEQDRRDERIEHRANAQVAYQDATRANLMLLHSLRGVGVIEDTTYRYGDGVRFINVIRLGGFDTTMSTKTNNIIHHSRAAAEKQTKKVIAEMEQILSDPTLEVRALDENMWEYTFNHTLGNGTVRRATTRVTFRKPKDEAGVAKGDFKGHPFRGNQWGDEQGNFEFKTGSKKTKIKVVNGTKLSLKAVSTMAEQAEKPLSVGRINFESMHTAVDAWTGRGQTDINNLIRGVRIGAEYKADAELYVKFFRKAFAKASVPLKADTVLFRGLDAVPKGFVFKVGQTFADKGFQSTTVDFKVAERYAGKKMIYIHAAKGTKVLAVGDSNVMNYDSGNTKRTNIGQLVLNEKTKFVVTLVEGNDVHVQIVGD